MYLVLTFFLFVVFFFYLSLFTLRSFLVRVFTFVNLYNYKYDIFSSGYYRTNKSLLSAHYYSENFFHLSIAGRRQYNNLSPSFSIYSNLFPYTFLLPFNYFLIVSHVLNCNNDVPVYYAILFASGSECSSRSVTFSSFPYTSNISFFVCNGGSYMVKTTC